MKPDLYTKAVLTVIAFMLVMIGCHQYISPATTVKAEGQFGGVQFSGNGNYWGFFDTRSGDLWKFDSGNGWRYEGRITALGQPLVKR
jgi:hypothetical protein